MVPEVNVPTETEMAFVPLPVRIVKPAGTVHV
jgi:hypothetical protein